MSYFEIEEEVKQGYALDIATITKTRYNGVYEGFPWVCFPFFAEELSNETLSGWQGEDIDCREWWNNPKNLWYVGAGISPTYAYKDMRKRIKRWLSQNKTH